MFASGRILFLGALWLAVLTLLLVFTLRVGDERVAIAAGPRGGDSFALANAIASVLEASHPQLSVEVYETHGSVENVRLLEEGRADLATMQSDVRTDGNVHAVASLFYDAYQLVVPADSAIESPADLHGRTVAIGPRGSGHFESFWFLVEHYGLDPDELLALPMSASAANFAMRRGQVDAIFRVHAVGNTSIRALTDDFPVRLVPIQQAEALAIRHPAVSRGAIARGSYAGHPPLPPSDLPTALVERFLVARAGLPDSVVLDVTRTLFEKRSRLISENSLAGYIAAPDVDGRLALPIHEGARRYYDREKPSFWQQNARILAPTLYVVVILSSAFLAIRSRVLARRRVRMVHYNLELMDIAEAAEAASKSADLVPLQRRLVAMLRQVVTDLDEQRVSQDEFEHFSFTWSAVDTLVRDRQGFALSAASGASEGEAGPERDA
jgi:TRAP transporter TAXI family solute receptor